MVDGRPLEADHVVWACGGWLAGLFPELAQLRVTRQEVVLFDARPPWASPPAPGWIDFDASVYGHALIEPHGMKVASDREGEPVEPGLRAAEAARGERGRGARLPRGAASPRWPARRCARRPRCHYSLTADGNFLFARHPDHERVWLLGGGSGHGFKHGPALAEHAAGVLAGARRAGPALRARRARAVAARCARPGPERGSAGLDDQRVAAADLAASPRPAPRRPRLVTRRRAVTVAAVEHDPLDAACRAAA